MNDLGLAVNHPIDEGIESYLRETLKNENLQTFLELDKINLPTTENREGYFGNRHFTYWLSGLYDYVQLDKYIPDLKYKKRILDFGSCSGRMIRHFAYQQPETEVVAIDLNFNYVDWINKNFPNNVVALKSAITPNIPIEDSSFDLIYALSVFTHIYEEEMGWLHELRRVLKKGCYAYLTVQTEDTWSQLPNITVYDHLKFTKTFNEFYEHNAVMPNNRFIFDYDDCPHCSYHVFHHSEYIKKHWSKLFKICDMIPNAHCSYQTVVVVQKN